MPSATRDCLTSNNEDLTINYQVDLYGTDKKTGQSQFVKKTVFKIHENTFGIDFKINLDRLIQNLTDSGKLTYQKQVGPPGKQGPRGKNGIDRLDTGPIGPAGTIGTSIPWPYSLTADTAAT